MPDDPTAVGGDGVAVLAPEVFTGKEHLSAEMCQTIHRIMVRTRAMELRMIKMSKSGLGHFWIGGPGEEGFNTCLGMQVRRGEGPRYDYLHLHYRNSATMVAMGMPLIEGIRQMTMTAADTHSLGRNFSSHFAKRAWNVIPVSSVIEVQYAMAPGTALMQSRVPGGDGVTIVTGGEAGSAEGDFASCLIWSTLPGRELPVLMVVTNNGWGISTSACSVHSERHTIDRGRAHGIPGEVVDGNDPVASWYAVQRAMDYCRRQRKPYMLEATVSRLYGHSSSSGALRVKDEPDPIEQFERRMVESGVMTRAMIAHVHEVAEAEVEAAVEEAAKDRMPAPGDEVRHTYAASPVDAVYPDDYTGLPS